MVGKVYMMMLTCTYSMRIIKNQNSFVINNYSTRSPAASALGLIVFVGGCRAPLSTAGLVEKESSGLLCIILTKSSSFLGLEALGTLALAWTCAGGSLGTGLMDFVESSGIASLFIPRLFVFSLGAEDRSLFDADAGLGLTDVVELPPLILGLGAELLVFFITGSFFGFTEYI